MKILDAQRARDLLDYDPITGVLTRKSRPRSDFKRDSDFTSWNRYYARTPVTSTDDEGYRVVMLDGRSYRAHRIAWLIVYGVWPKVIDHQDGCRSNNSLSNLRDVTVKENNRNRGIRSDNTSGFPGVYRRGSRWQASIKCDGRSRSLGVFDTPAQAWNARKKAEADRGFHPNHGRAA